MYFFPLSFAFINVFFGAAFKRSLYHLAGVPNRIASFQGRSFAVELAIIYQNNLFNTHFHQSTSGSVLQDPIVWQSMDQKMKCWFVISEGENGTIDTTKKKMVSHYRTNMKKITLLVEYYGEKGVDCWPFGDPFDRSRLPSFPVIKGPLTVLVATH